ncbi:MAG: GNAT family N-acetyltransferase [Firmicutes bacterium]|nr:GNAT family N-acetyltransferase [Bacillota bacterium]
MKKSSNIDNLKLSDKYSIVRANKKEFAVYDSVYGDRTNNRFAVKHWDLRLAVSLDNPFAKEESFYWIKACEKRVGGVIIEPNLVSRLFFIPPFENKFEIIKLLKKELIKLSDTNKDINAFQIPLEQSQYFERLGFWPSKSRRWMMRPTETFKINWNNNLLIKIPEKSYDIEIAKLFSESFKGDIDSNYIDESKRKECSYKDYIGEINDYFKYTEGILLEASTLIFDKEEKRLIGACLVSSFEEWPLIHTIGVHPSYRGKHLASMMLKKALTVLNKKYPVVRLFVTIGNGAESVYYELGFIPGVEFKKLYIPAIKN